MNIIIPMAGMGKRLRPHTLSIPKPLMPIAGKPIVQRLVEDIAKVCPANTLHEIAFIIGDFGIEIENRLLEIAASVGAKGRICYQNQALGTAHAILCAKESLSGNVIVAYADTLFRADFELNPSHESIIWVQQVPNPNAFGVVKLNEANQITDFIEKPTEYVSDLAIIGIYYFREGENLRHELEYLIENNIQVKGEYQLTDALENMKNKGVQFMPGQVAEWLDCGNKEATIQTNQRYLTFIDDTDLIAKTAKITNTTIIPPVFIGEDTEIHTAVIGPYVSVGKGTKITGSIVQNSIIQENTVLQNLNIANSMIGNFVNITGSVADLNLGDYNSLTV